MSDVFRAFREIVLNLTCHECDDGLRMVPTIYFNWQNIDKQETYRPIKVSEYNLYVRKLIARMGPEYDCIDGRRTDGLR